MALENTEPGEPWAALLPALDPITMGWYERDWYVGLELEAARFTEWFVGVRVLPRFPLPLSKAAAAAR